MATSAPAAITAFLAIAQAALPGQFNVRFSTIFDPNVTPQALLVTGVHFNMDDFAELGPAYRHEERYTLECQICSFSGEDDQPARLAEVYVLYEMVSVAVANNPTLNDTVRVAQTRQMDYSPTYDAKGGNMGILTFEIECQQRVNSLI